MKFKKLYVVRMLLQTGYTIYGYSWKIKCNSYDIISNTIFPDEKAARKSLLYNMIKRFDMNKPEKSSIVIEDFIIVDYTLNI